MRKALSVIITIISALAATLPAGAQLAPGEWSFPPAFEGGRTTAIHLIGDKVYFLSGINIFSYNPSTRESVALTADARLSGVKAVNLFGDPDGKRLIVVYDDANMDVIKPDGSIIPVSVIRDTQITGTREIRDIAFIGPKAYIATDFGMVVLNCDTGRVIESGQYRGGADGHINGGPLSLTVSGDRLMALFNGGHLYSSLPGDASQSYRDTAKFTAVGVVSDNINGTECPASEIHTVSENILVGVIVSPTDENRLYKVALPWGAEGRFYVLNYGGRKVSTTDIWTDSGVLHIPMNDSRVGVITDAGIRVVSKLPEAVTRYRAITSTKSDKSTWIATPEGLHHYDLTQTPPAKLDDIYRPAARSVVNVSRMTRNANDDGIIAYTRSNSDGQLSGAGSVAEPLQKEMRKSAWGYGDYVPGFIDLVIDGSALDFTPTAADADLPVHSKYPQGSVKAVRNRYGDVIPSILGVAQNPADPSQTWISSDTEGLFRVSGGKVNASFAGSEDPTPNKFAVDNIPIVGYYGQHVYDVRFDPAGNLWVLASNGIKSGNRKGAQLMMLPAAMVSLPAGAVKKEDWITKRANGTYLLPESFVDDVEGHLEMLTRSNCIAVVGKFSAQGLYIYRYGSNPSDVNSSGGINLTTVYDQDGNSIDVQYVTAVAEDPKGQLVVSSHLGFYVIPSPATFDPTRDRVRRLKVNNNDGTGTASYLLNGVTVSAIDFDSAGRMWVSTEGSGVSVISADYDEVEEQFNTDNSPLPTNYVSALALDPLTNKVYVGGAWGLGVYASEQSPGREDYDEVRVYPNPVRPGFNGQVTVDGLMNASLVKVVDAMGNLVHSGPSLGGTFRWNLRDMGGAPVKSGVYYICPSQSDDDSGPKGKVAAKLLVIR